MNCIGRSKAADAWLLWAEISLKYGAAFVILAQAHQLYTQRATLLQVADTARILRVSTYSLILLAVGNYFTKAGMPRLLLAYFWVFATLLLVIQKYSTSRAHSRLEIACRPPAQGAHLRHNARNPASVLLSAALSPSGPDSGWISR